MIKATVKAEKYKPGVGTEHSAGADLRVSGGDFVIPAGEGATISTGVSVAIPEGYVGLVVPRSSMGKIGVRLANTVGVIDADYRGEIKLLVENAGDETMLLYDTDRIAQLIVVPYMEPRFIYVNNLDKTERGENGFGSTGVQ